MFGGFDVPMKLLVMSQKQLVSKGECWIDQVGS